MDPSLLKERDAFKKRAMAMPAVEKRKAKPADSGPSKKTRPSRPPVEKKPFDYKSTPGSSANKFGILAKIVNYMKTRHQHGDTHPLTIDEILDETNQLDIGYKQKHWLLSEALKDNPKIEVKDGETFVYKPKYNITSKKKLLKLLDKNDREGLGGILLDDVEEALPNCAKALKSLGDDILYITKPDKKQILFYNDKSAAFTVDEEFQKLWRGVAVEGIDERKIEEHLQKHGISSMQDIGLKKVVPIRKKKGSRKGGVSNLKKTNNEHMKDILKDYSSVTK